MLGQRCHSASACYTSPCDNHPEPANARGPPRKSLPPYRWRLFLLFYVVTGAVPRGESSRRWTSNPRIHPPPSLLTTPPLHRIHSQTPPHLRIMSTNLPSVRIVHLKVPQNLRMCLRIPPDLRKMRLRNLRTTSLRLQVVRSRSVSSIFDSSPIYPSSRPDWKSGSLIAQSTSMNFFAWKPLFLESYPALRVKCLQNTVV